MRKKLPAYAVNCLLAAGFDSTDVLSSMDVTEGPNNSIEVTEKTGTFPCFQGEKSVYMCKNNDSQGLLLLPLCL